ncbi:MAG: DNA-directed RNA polymerase subunit alpha [Eubacteriales bacterium]|nr:DNA-directed RNA polymerase subunit alpha [Clostridia bacterium]MDY2696207.1 DNA-directed RNA polymerase subunit alpha [Eubacteriales bacterium]
MMEMEKPRITCEETEGGSYARFIVEPLEKGYGITLGNAMRRTLLSSLPGVAPIAIRMTGVMHEFSSVPGVTEDVVDIILNLKYLAVKTDNNDKDFTTTLHLKHKGAGEIKASDFDSNSDIEILNPELHICTCDDDANFDLELLIGRGRGYVPNNLNKEKLPSADYIAMDSLFSPVKKVNYAVESTRVGQSIDFDKLTLEVETDGTVTAREIVSLAGKIINEHVNLFIELCDNMSDMQIMVSKEEDEQVKVLEMPIEEMDLSVRSYNCLKRANINTVDDLTKKSKSDMLKVRNLGLKSIEEVVAKLQTYGLGLRNDEE